MAHTFTVTVPITITRYAHIWANPTGQEAYCDVRSPWVIDVYFGTLRHFDYDYIETFGADTHDEAIAIANRWLTTTNEETA